MEKRNAVWILLTALTISLVIVGGSLSLSLRQEKSAAQGTTYSEAATMAQEYRTIPETVPARR